MQNPFKPTAGARPPLLIGRDDIRAQFAESLEDGAGAPGLLSFFTGPRGVGKTVMLGEIEDEAIEHGWIIISETATEGLIGRIADAIRTASEELGDGPAGRRITAVTVGPIRVDTQLPTERRSYWRHQATDLLARLDLHGTGLLITIDEIHAVDKSELTELAAVVQHFIREGLPIGLAMAGLPKAVSDLLNDGVATFLRRAERHNLHSTSIRDVRSAFQETFAASSVGTTAPHLDLIAEGTGGYPFLIQLVGYHVWRLARREGHTTDDTVRAGLDNAFRRMGSTVLESAFSALSDIDRTYLLRMAEDDGPARTATVAQRMGVRLDYANVYRRRLIDAGAIEPAKHGSVDFAVPRMREFMREQPGFGVHL